MSGYKPVQDNEAKSPEDEMLSKPAEAAPKSYSASMSYKGFEVPSLGSSQHFGSPPLGTELRATGIVLNYLIMKL